MRTDKRIFNTDLLSKTWLGEVVDISDPLKQGKCRIIVFGLFEDLDNEHIPWAAPVNSGTFSSIEEGGSGSISIPKLGSIVRVQFNNGDIYAPEWIAIQNINPTLLSEIGDDYEGTHVLLYDVDEELKVIYQKNRGIQIYLKGSQVTINPDSSITIEHKDTESIIELVGSTINMTTQNDVNVTAANTVNIESQDSTINGTQVTKLGPLPNFSGVRAEPLWAFLKSLSATVDAKWPATPGVNSAAAEAGEQTSTSNNVKIT